MTKNPPRIFISYSRKDGEDFAANLRGKLIAIFGEDGLWRDRDKMEGGVRWWDQITEALDAVQFMVLVATPEAMQSPVVRKEWRYARQQGVCVYPVQVPGLPLDFAVMPRWMRDSHFYNLDKEWDTFVNYLKSPCNSPKVAFMAPDLPAHFVQRPREFDQLKNLLLDDERDNPVAITTALKGAGGFGKTTLAAALCHDEDVQQAFDDGILWVTLGENPSLLDALTKLYRALTDDIPGFVDVEEGATKLAERLADLDCLIVIDDVWNPAHLRPFLRGGERSARLVTTRLLDVAVSAEAKRIDVDEMTADESTGMLMAGIEGIHNPQPFAELAKRLGEWPLLLELVNGALRKHIARGRSPAQALAEVTLDLDEEGVTAFDQRSPQARNDAITRSLNVSMGLLEEAERTNLFMLAIFPEDTDIPSGTAAVSLRVSERRAGRQLELYNDLSLLRYDPEQGTFRLHDVMRKVLAERLDDPAAVHRRLLAAWGGDLTTLPDAYAWRNVAYHLVGAGQMDPLRALLLNADFLQNKLNATADPNLLLADCDLSGTTDRAVRLVKSALSNSSHILVNDPAQGLTHIYGRLLSYRDEIPEIAALLDVITAHETHPALLAAQPTLPQAGGPVLRTFTGHTDYVSAVAFAPDGKTALSASHDRNLKLWDVANGRELRTFTGHTDYVSAVAFAPNGETALSASWSNTFKLWNIDSREEIRTFIGHRDKVNAVAFGPDGKTALSASDDRTLRLWNIDSGAEIRAFIGHIDKVTAVAFAPDGKTALSASWDHTLRLWNIDSGAEIRAFIGHADNVTAVAFAPDGKTALTASWDHTLRLWNIDSGAEIRAFIGHTDNVTAVAFAPDGKTALSVSYDRTLKLWEIGTANEIRTFTSHTDSVTTVAFAPDGKTALSASADNTLKLWDIGTANEIPAVTGHANSVTAMAFAPDGKTALSSSLDRTLKLWDTGRGDEIRTFTGHADWVNGVIFAPDGKTALSASSDNTLKLWDISTGSEIRTFIGHTNDVWAVALAPDGKTALSASFDSTLKLWDIDSGAEIRTFTGNADAMITAVAFTPDGKTALSALFDGTLKLWDVSSGAEIRTFTGHNDAVNAVAFAQDSRTALSTSEDRTLKLWDVLTGNLLHDLPDHPDNRAGMFRQYEVLLDPLLGDINLMLIGAARGLEIWQRSARQFAFAADAAIWGYDITPSLHIAAGEEGGTVHLLRPNPALRRLLLSSSKSK